MWHYLNPALRRWTGLRSDERFAILALGLSMVIYLIDCFSPRGKR